MSYKDELFQLIKNNHGLILTKDVTNAGIPREYISQLVENGILEKIDRSSYVMKGSPDDIMYRIQAKHPVAIFSHESAMFLHGLIEKEIDNHVITVPAGYNSKVLKEMGLKVHFAKKDLYEIGISITKTTYGREIKTYNMERTICDIIKNRKHLEPVELSKILKEYSTSKEKNLDRLIEYGKHFRVSNILNLYMVVLV